MGGPKFKDPEDKKIYTNNLNAFMQMLVKNQLAPATYVPITDNNYDAANDYLQIMLNEKSIMLPGMNKLEGTTPLDFIDKLSEMMPDEPEKLTNTQLHNNVNNWIFLYDKENNEYKQVNLTNGSLTASKSTLKNANVWRSMDAIREAVHNLDAELEGTKSPWSSDTDEFKAVKKNLSELNKKLKEMNAFTTDKDGNLIARDYTFEDMTKEFETLMSSIGSYRDVHRFRTLSDRQADRLEIMSRVSTAYENIRLAGIERRDKEGNIVHPELTSKGFNYQDIYDKIFLTKLKLWNTDYYHTALKNRAFFNDLRNRMKSDPAFQNDLKTLKPEGLSKLTEAELKEKAYFAQETADLKPSEMSSIEEQVLYSIYTSFEKKEALAKIASENNEANLQNNPNKEKISYKYGIDARRLLNAYALDRGIKGSGKDGKIEVDDLRDVHRAFMKEVKSGSLLVFDRNGKRADSLDALQIMADRMNHPDGRSAFFRYDQSVSAYVANDIAFGTSQNTGALTVNGFKADTTKMIGKDYFMVCDAVIKEVRDLRKDLYEARSFWHSKEHNAMSDALDKICEKFDQIDLSKCEPDQMQKAFVELADAADKYAESHMLDGAKHNLNDKQVDRLVVAQKIMSIKESLNNPKITYKDYMKNRLAQKVNFDIMRVTDAEWKKVKDQPVDKEKDPKGYLLRERIIASDQLYKTDLTKNHTVKYLGRSPQEWLNNKVLKNVTGEASATDLEEALKWTPEQTIETIGINVLDNKSANRQITEKAELIMGRHESLTPADLGVEDLFKDDITAKAQQAQEMAK